MTNEFTEYRVREIEAFEARARGDVPKTPHQLADRLSSHQPNGAATMPLVEERCDHNRFAAQQAARLTEPMPAAKPPIAKTPAAVAPMQSRPAVARTSFDIVHAALESGNVEMYREAVALAKELDAIAARKAFDNALADAKAKLPVIKKNSHVTFDSKGGGTDYWHEDLAEVVGTIAPILSGHGLSHRWRLKGKPGEPITVWCIISHRDGHREENEISAGADATGGKNPIQAMKSAVSYMERITLMASLGLASRRDDDDGRGNAGEAPKVEEPTDTGGITAVQIEQIRVALKGKGASQLAFLQWARHKRFEDIPAEHFESCMKAIANFRSNNR